MHPHCALRPVSAVSTWRSQQAPPLPPPLVGGAPLPLVTSRALQALPPSSASSWRDTLSFQEHCRPRPLPQCLVGVTALLLVTAGAQQTPPPSSTSSRWDTPFCHSKSTGDPAPSSMSIRWTPLLLVIPGTVLEPMCEWFWGLQAESLVLCPPAPHEH